MPNSILRCLFPVLTLVLFSAPLAFAQSSRRPPNIILIMADDMGFECLGCYGGTSYRTPNLDRAAKQGIRFDHVYSTPICTTSRVQIMTGKYNFRNYEAFGYLNPNQTTFGQLMQRRGYKTMIAGKWQLNGHYKDLRKPGWDNPRRPLEAGFDECYVWQVTDRESERYWGAKIVENGSDKWLPKSIYTPDYLVDRICEFATSNRDQPFFVYYPMLLVHNPFIRTPDSQTNKPGKAQAFADMVVYTDKLYGRIERHIQDLGLSDDTIILFTGDNGTNRSIKSQLGDRIIQGGKAMPHDGGTHVPLIASWPGKKPVGNVSDQLIDFTDFLPTLVEASGQPLEKGFLCDGVSFLPTICGQPGSKREWVFCHYDPMWGKWPAVQFARDSRFKIYDDGRTYDVAIDFYEQRPLSDEIHSKSDSTAIESLARVMDKMPNLPIPGRSKQNPFNSKN